MMNMSTLRDDELSERYFYLGCFGLPWLWIVHTFNYHSKQKANEGNAALLESDKPKDPVEEEIALAEKQWVNRCRSSAITVSVAWIVWVLMVQVVLTDSFPAGLFVRDPEQGEYTGW